MVALPNDSMTQHAPRRAPRTRYVRAELPFAAVLATGMILAVVVLWMIPAAGLMEQMFKLCISGVLGGMAWLCLFNPMAERMSLHFDPLRHELCLRARGVFGRDQIIDHIPFSEISRVWVLDNRVIVNDRSGYARISMPLSGPQSRATLLRALNEQMPHLL